ncbi:hypothetical protein Ngar_c28000 [Candidatus Nitrososphaera gargensis Ga9.2]|uniref:Uncharacterized protein n=1 Tax=Nitrososphaera gargensis (strain Ga9.2) TaxID=1237085 RepID=K0IEF9_NITGG|nr:hypothetical protein [Candidatus Nitrososphaera gargensis]AFU59721.1 hypothetical protein Ngar_c28000 [Candidatus Nitrososphaera gargensis Ga9.2]
MTEGNSTSNDKTIADIRSAILQGKYRISDEFLNLVLAGFLQIAITVEPLDMLTVCERE